MPNLYPANHAMKEAAIEAEFGTRIAVNFKRQMASSMGEIRLSR